MLPARTIKNLQNVISFLCSFGAVTYTGRVRRNEFQLENVTSEARKLHDKSVLLATICHTLFISLRLAQAYFSRSQKFFILFLHFSWTVTFYMITCLHVSLIMCHSGVKAYVNGLFRFYTSYFTMPGARLSAKERRRTQKSPCLIDWLVLAFLIGAILNTLVTVQIFFIYPWSYLFAYSAFPSCWKESFPSVKFVFGIYEMLLPGVNWTLVLFFVIVHLIHLLCTRDYLLLLRRNTRNGVLKLDELVHHYRSVQVLQNHYNECIASFLPFELLVVTSLTLVGNIGTIRMFHLNVQTSISELLFLPLISLITTLFQFIFYQRAGEINHVSAYFQRSCKKGLFGHANLLANMYLRACPPLYVKIGNIYKIRKFSVVRFFGGIVVGTARLSVLFFNWKYDR